jgi:hypothetical protein
MKNIKKVIKTHKYYFILILVWLILVLALVFPTFIIGCFWIGNTKVACGVVLILLAWDIDKYLGKKFMELWKEEKDYNKKSQHEKSGFE